MQRVILVVLALVLVSCGAEDPADTTAPTVPVAVDSTGPQATEPTPETTTSTVGAQTTTTIASTTTTAPVAVVTVDPHLPAALGRTAIPWSSVGDGWYVVLYDSSKAAPTSSSDVRDGPVVLYLVAPDGTLYETAAWAPEDRPWRIVDVRADGTAALVQGNAATPDTNAWVLVDLPTGATQTVHEASFPEVTYGWGSYVKLTKPTGANVVVYRSDGTNEWLERRSPGGSLLATVYQQTYIDAVSSLAWMYGHGGTTLLVTHHGGIALVQNDGTLLDELWVPMDHRCEPVRWWDADTFLATCYGQGPGSAPLDEYGNPHTFFGQVWLLETDGTAGAPMTALPTAPPMVVDFGHHDAWPAGSTTFVAWSGDCGASAAQTLNANGTTASFPISIPASVVADGWQLIDVVSGQLGIYAWQGCAADVGVLFAADLTGAFSHELVPVMGDARSVISVRGLAEVYP